ncbi:MAG: DNA-formamidopyrimidine glycosylase family protein [Pseudomonadota bacterium]
MPEIPDLECYRLALTERIEGSTLRGIRLASPFVLRSVAPSIDDVIGAVVTKIRRMGKRLVVGLSQDDRSEARYIVFHLMIAGRLRWYDAGKKIPARYGLMAFDFDVGTLGLTEAGKKHRASVHLIEGADNLMALHPGGRELTDLSLSDFIEALTRENHTVKRSLTDQRFLGGIGNAYSDEILHQARISPMRQVKYLTDEDWQQLYIACNDRLDFFTHLLNEKRRGKFPEKVTAFVPEMAVHGQYGNPCPECGHPVQRIRYADNECNYCAHCQNEDRLLADRGLSRLLKQDWPRRLEDLEQ